MGIFGIIQISAQPRFELGSTNFVGYAMSAEANLLNQPCNLVQGSSSDTSSAQLQSDLSYLAFRELLIGDLGGGSCAQSGSASVLMRIRGIGTNLVIITWTTDARAQFDWKEICPCPPVVHAFGNAETELACAVRLEGLPANSQAKIEYLWTQLCRVGADSEGIGEDSAFSYNQLLCNGNIWFLDSVSTRTKVTKEVGMIDQNGEFFAADSVLFQVFSRVFADIETPPMGNTTLEDDAFAISYGVITLQITGIVSETKASPSNLPVFRLIPNPTREGTEVFWTQRQPANVVFQISDLTGAVLKEINTGYRATGEHRVYIPTSELSPGVYLFSGQQMEGASQYQFPAKRLVVIH